MEHIGLRRGISFFLAVSMLTPSLGLAQPSPGSQQPPPPAGVPLRVQPPATSRGAMPGPDYRLAAGDVLDVQISGRLDTIRQQPVVDYEGRINISPLGTIPVGGLTLLETHRRVADRARAVFRFAEATVTVVTPRTFEIVVSGEVERPGSLQVTATRRLHDVVLEVGGITPRGSVRRVAVTRRGVESEADLLAFELRGDLSQNPYVEEGLKIHVPPRAGSVMLSGAVRRPGEYEIGTAGSLRALLELVGGVSQAGAASDARLTRVGADDRKETLTLDLRTALKDPDDVVLQPGDALFVPPITVLQDLVEFFFNDTATTES